MLDADVFAREVHGYNKSPSKTLALKIWGMYFGPDSRRPLRISQFVREELRECVAAYGDLKDERDAKYGRLNPLKQVKRALSAKEARAESGIFDAAAAETKRNKKLTGVQIALLDLTHMKASYQAEKVKALSDLRRANMPGTTAQAAQAIQRSDLTINFKASTFFSTGVLNRDGYLNMWTRGASPMDNVDTRERNRAEVNAFEQFRYQTDFDGPSRPLYAALNVGRRAEGSAGGYGMSYFVLTDLVKQRSTYTPSDTFYISRYRVSQQALDSVRSKLDPELYKAVQKDVGKIIDDLQAGAPAFNGWINQILGTLSKSGKLAKKSGESADAFEDRKRVYAQELREALRTPGEQDLVTSYERMDRIVAYLEGKMLSQISSYAANPDARNLKLPTYVEAQVHGPINFSTDVERMVIADWEVEGDQTAQTNLEQFSKKHNIPYSYITLGDLG